MRKILTALLIVLCLSQSPSTAQEGAKSRRESPDEESVSSWPPVVFGKKGDGLPEKLRVRGVITELSFAQAYCGTIFWSGTISVKLLDKVAGYPHENVFIVVPCLLDPDNEGKYLNKTVSLEVSKLYGEYNRYGKKKPCYFEAITNTLNSHGVPFYCSQTGQEGLLKSIERQGASEKRPG